MRGEKEERGNGRDDGMEEDIGKGVREGGRGGKRVVIILMSIPIYICFTTSLAFVYSTFISTFLT